MLLREKLRAALPAVVLPTLAAVTLLAVLIGALLHYSTARSDALALERQIRLITLAVQESAASVANEQEASTLWDDAVLRDKAVKQTLSGLRSAGFQIVLDDFGTGYSSLSYLRKFEVDKIKIDQSFVRYLGMADDSSSIVVAVLALGHALGLTVAAEGVETQDQSEFLSSVGCREMQGFLFSQAVPEEDLPRLIGEGARRATAG